MRERRRTPESRGLPGLARAAARVARWRRGGPVERTRRGAGAMLAAVAVGAGVTAGSAMLAQCVRDPDAAGARRAPALSAPAGQPASPAPPAPRR